MKYEGKYNILRVYLSEVSGKETLYNHLYVTYTSYRLQMNIRGLRKKGSECNNRERRQHCKGQNIEAVQVQVSSLRLRHSDV